LSRSQPMQSDMNWFGVLAYHASRTPAKPLCVFGDESVSYEEMATRSAALGAGLREHGVGAGDVVGLLSYNCPEFLETIFAANYLGAIAMPINWRLAAPELRYILGHSRARALVCDASLIDLANEATKGMEADLLRACLPGSSTAGWTALADRRGRRGARRGS
jgi:fatty-acyl-CoA synthase